MNKSVQWKLLAVVAVAVLSAVAVYPPGERIRLGRRPHGPEGSN